MAIFKINEGSYDFGEHKKTAKSIEARIASAIGAYPKGAYVPYQSSGYTLTRQDRDYRFTKQNFCLYPFGYNITKDDELAMKNSIKSAGGKYIVSSYGNIHFYIDETPFITARDTEQAEIDNDFNLRKSEYEDKLNAEDIEKYKPTDKILAKLQDYRSRGSKVNVKAIKDINKLLTYFYGACLMNWKDLYYSCIDVIPDEYRDIQNAISFRCEANSDLIDTRDTYTQNIAAQFSRVTSFLYDNNIGYKFIKRTPTSAELDLDRRNGRCWTLAYTLELDNGTKVNFANHTNEGGGTYGYSINGGPRISKKEVEDLIIKDIKRNLNTAATDDFMHEANKPNGAPKYKNYYIVADPAGDGYNVFDINKNLEDEGYGSVEDAKAFIDTLDESFDAVGYPTRSMSFDELTKLIKHNLDSDFISLDYNGKAGAGKCDATFTRIDGSWARTNKKGEPLNSGTVNEINSLRLSNSEVFKELIYCLKNNDVFNLTLGTKSEDDFLDESLLTEDRLSGSYDKTQLENDLLALSDVDKVDWDLSAYDELGEVIVLIHRAFEDSLDMSTYYMQRTNLLREILKVFDKNNLKLVDPIEDQGTWWYFVLEHKNSVESSDKPQLEYVMVEFFETSGTPADDIMRRTKDVKYTDLSKLSELLVNADKIFREIDKYGGYNKVYFDNYIRYQGKLYKFHAGRVDIGDGPAEVSIPANYPEQVIDYFLSELNSGNKDIPIVEE